VIGATPNSERKTQNANSKRQTQNAELRTFN